MPKKKNTKSAAAADDPARFEQALAELEEIVGEMEGDRVPLDELLKKYERGTSLLRLCQGQVASARARIEQIAQRAKNGGVSLEPFDPDSEESTKTAGSVSKGTKDPERPTTPDDDIQLL
ncbi:MAG: exodeoxyribonuclease VII small subunit [Verrucomicrobiales bacterium]